VRRVTRRYDDPLDRVWLTAAERVGLRVRRSADAFASTDGRGTLIIGSADTLDPDDCLAQMIFHELCHSLVQGPESFAHPDWGLDNEGARDLVRDLSNSFSAIQPDADELRDADLAVKNCTE